MAHRKSSNISAEVKAQARRALTGHYGTVIAANLLYLIISFMIAEFGVSLGTGTGIVYLILSFLFNGVAATISGVFTLGLYFIYVNLLFDQPASVQDLFHPFRENPQKAMAIAAVFYLADYVCTLPSTLYLSMSSAPVYDRLLFCFFLMALDGLAMFFFQLYFLFTYFLLLDYPSMTVRELFHRSSQLMRGKKRTLFYIEFSFLPLYLIGFLTFGIGCLYVMAYQFETVTAFYRYCVCDSSTRQQTF